MSYSVPILPIYYIAIDHTSIPFVQIIFKKIFHPSIHVHHIHPLIVKTSKSSKSVKQTLPYTKHSNHNPLQQILDSITHNSLLSQTMDTNAQPAPAKRARQRTKPPAKRPARARSRTVVARPSQRTIARTVPPVHDSTTDQPSSTRCTVSPLFPDEITGPAITGEHILTVANDVANGSTLKQACLGHIPPISVKAMESKLRTRGAYKKLYEIGQARYVLSATKDISNGVQGWQGRAWILERRHGSQFQRRPDQVVQSTTVMTIDPAALGELSGLAKRVHADPTVRAKAIKTGKEQVELLGPVKTSTSRS